MGEKTCLPRFPNSFTSSCFFFQTCACRKIVFVVGEGETLELSPRIFFANVCMPNVLTFPFSSSSSFERLLAPHFFFFFSLVTASLYWSS